MKNKWPIFSFLFFFLAFTSLCYAQAEGPESKMEALKISPKIVLGNMISYSFQIQNNGDKPVDAVKWTAKFYDNFGELIDTKEDSFNAASKEESIPAGSSKSMLKFCKYKGATMVKITFIKAHFAE